VGRLPGEGLHRRRLLKYAAPVALIQVLPDPRSDGPADAQPLGTAPDGVAEAVGDSGTVRLAFDPALPDLTALPDGARRDGSWSVSADAVRLTGGRWFVERDGDQVQAGLDVTEHWRPRRLPLVMRVVTTVVPVFRGGRRRTGGGQSSVPAARPRVAGRGSAPHMVTTIVGPPAPDQRRYLRCR
jgi:hypothetical protein